MLIEDLHHCRLPSHLHTELGFMLSTTYLSTYMLIQDLQYYHLPSHLHTDVGFMLSTTYLTT
jgi:hypothetical protein